MRERLWFVFRKSGIWSLRSGACFSAVVLVLLAEARLLAADLRYSAPSACPAKDELSFQVQRGLGKSLELVQAAPIRVAIREAKGAFSARLVTIHDESGGERVREISASNCAELVDALSVAIVLAIEEQTVESAAKARSELTRPSALDATVAAPLHAEPSASVVEPGRLTDDAADATFAVGLWLLADVGALPDPAPGVGLSAELGGSRWRLRALGAAWIEQRVELPLEVSPRVGADLNFFFGSLAGCHRAGIGGALLSLSGCLSWELGYLSGQGAGVAEPLDDGLLWLAPGAALELRWEMAGSGFHFDAQLGAVVPLNRSEFFLKDIGAVHRPANLIGRAGLGIGLSL